MTTACGSPIYAAPELLSKNFYGPSVDIWSIGVILYNLLFGKMPFDLDTNLSVHVIYMRILKVRTLKVPSNMRVSGELLDLLRRMLCIDPEKRISINEILDHDVLRKEVLYYQKTYGNEYSKNIDKTFFFDLAKNVGEKVLKIYEELELEGASDWVLFSSDSKTSIKVYFPYGEPQPRRLRFCASMKLYCDLLFLKKQFSNWCRIYDQIFTITEKVSVLDENSYIFRSYENPQSIMERSTFSTVTLLSRSEQRLCRHKEVLVYIIHSVSTSLSPLPENMHLAEVTNSGFVFQPMEDNVTLCTFIYDLKFYGEISDDELSLMKKMIPTRTMKRIYSHTKELADLAGKNKFHTLVTLSGP
jgi:serine/threonine protein kinase